MGRILTREQFDAILEMDPEKMPPMVYLAGAFFNEPQTKLIDKAEIVIAASGWDVISPRKILTISPGGQNAEERAAAFQYNLDAMRVCSVVVAMCDHPDTGTHWEMGWAHHERRLTGLPYIVGCWFDYGKTINLMLSEGVDGIVREWHVLQEGLSKFLEDDAMFEECFDKSALGRVI